MEKRPTHTQECQGVCSTLLIGLNVGYSCLWWMSKCVAVALVCKDLRHWLEILILIFSLPYLVRGPHVFFRSDIHGSLISADAGLAPPLSPTRAQLWSGLEALWCPERLRMSEWSPEVQIIPGGFLRLTKAEDGVCRAQKTHLELFKVNFQFLLKIRSLLWASTEALRGCGQTYMACEASRFQHPWISVVTGFQGTETHILTPV